MGEAELVKNEPAAVARAVVMSACREISPAAVSALLAVALLCAFPHRITSAPADSAYIETKCFECVVSGDSKRPLRELDDGMAGERYYDVRQAGGLRVSHL